ncbi:MAG: hypothetical protein M1819_000943 [Sarea resinae]|nr:MAG: hypothetical protein M1819_000943 [Sarea resinae]
MPSMSGKQVWIVSMVARLSKLAREKGLITKDECDERGIIKEEDRPEIWESLSEMWDTMGEYWAVANDWKFVVKDGKVSTVTCLDGKYGDMTGPEKRIRRKIFVQRKKDGKPAIRTETTEVIEPSDEVSPEQPLS